MKCFIPKILMNQKLNHRNIIMHLKSVNNFTQFSTKSNQITRFFPKAPKPSEEEIDKVNEFISKHQQILILSGAGLSTESGIPDYRSKDVGLYYRTNHKPMKHGEFMSSSVKRQKYWARNYLGWKTFQQHSPNISHHKLCELENIGKVHWHVTQNVDGLLTNAGCKYITELHGCLHRVVCLNCKMQICRTELQDKFNDLNKSFSADIIGFGPDADAFISDKDVVDFQVPSCECCGGILKPDVVFFGDNVSQDTVQFVNEKVDKSDGLLVVGSSLQVWSGYKFIVKAYENSIPIAAVNVGPTRADKLLALKVNALCSEVFSKVKF